MRVPVTWLRSYCDPDLPTEAIAERLDLTGTELERVERVGVGDTANFVVGKVLSAEKHPAADRLSVCEVDDGSGGPRTIVCGAPNVAAGQTVAVARPGAVMPDGTELGEAELRGVKSSGMILAEDEVGLGPDHDGIMVLPDGLQAGAPLQDALPIADEVLELEITPNRPDCLAIYGVAREVHAATGAVLSEDPTSEDAEPADGATPAAEQMTVEIADPEICLRFTARVFEDVKLGPSPEWLKQRLSAAGQRPISNVVDITNYVMLCTGQPLHAFDMDEVRGGRIVVRRAEAGERMTTLDDVEREFDSGMALVCDAEGPSGIAGVMGGQVSEVSDKTTRVLMEAATWVGPNILQTSKKLGLRSEASTRFEKQLHPEQAIAAQRLAGRLMVELCGARMAPGTIDAYPEPLRPLTVNLRLDRVERLLGKAIARDEVVAILDLLGFATEGGEVLKVTVPPWRDADVRREADLIEEVARIYGLDRLPTTLPARERAVGRLTPSQRLRRRLEDALRDRGLHEVVAWSFTSPEALERLRIAGEPALALANPLSEDQSVMRPLLLPGLLDAARHNAAHGATGLALFESGHTYRPADGLGAPEGSPRGATPATERHHIGAVLTQRTPATWRSPAAPADFYAAKGLVEALAAAAPLDLDVAPGVRPFLHPGRSATVTVGGREVGWIGELHPLVAGAWDLEGAAAFELDAGGLTEEAEQVADFHDVTSFPAALQDIAVVVPADVSAAEVRATVREGGGELLASTEVFDVYTGEQAGEGNRSLALRLRFQAPDRTLTDAAVADLRTAIEAALERIGGRLRG
ncbi:MAG TPA: phenylalanine--tRNA ligase subunit beta [Thermoleophilaceae bacterium]|nr:phenylalanine--tRNA ligase subunit beta [Thermoleophilaceae bacterium]